MTALCLVCLIASLVLAGLFVINWLISFKNRHGFLGGRNPDELLFSPFSKMVAALFVAIMILFVPIYWYGLAPSGVWSTVFKTLFLSAQNSLQLFVINASFDNVREMISSIQGLPDLLADTYTAVVAVYFIIAPLLTAAVALSLVKGLYESWRYVRNTRVKKLYIMSDLNEYSLALAQDILTNYAYRDEDVLTQKEYDDYLDIDPNTPTCNGRKINRQVVFAGVTPRFAEDNPVLVEQAKELGAICLAKDITHIGLKRNKDIFRKLYFIADNEDANVTQAMVMIDVCSRLYNTDKTRLYVFAVSEESGVVLDSCIAEARRNNGEGEPFRLRVRRVDEKRNFIWQMLLQSEAKLNGTKGSDVPYIFSSAVPVDGSKQINVLIVGMGIYGCELLRTLCWYCQMPNYKLTVYSFDGFNDPEDRIRAMSPELISQNRTDGQEVEGEANYRLVFFDRSIKDARSARFADEVARLKNLTAVFVNLGDDAFNVEMALKIRHILGKNYPEGRLPLIFATVYASEKFRYLDNGFAIKGENGKVDYRIRFIGDTASRFSLANVEQSRLERIGEVCHLIWTSRYLSGDSEQQRRQWQLDINKYTYTEYLSKSSQAQAMHLIARETLADELPAGEALAINEHKRWNAYMRAQGYTCVPKNGDKEVKSSVDLVHSCLVPYDKLTDTEKHKDDVEGWKERARLVRETEAKLYGKKD